MYTPLFFIKLLSHSFRKLKLSLAAIILTRLKDLNSLNSSNSLGSLEQAFRLYKFRTLS
jgi:hypothetical protein